jgi:DNA polymerase III epsilon subunit-like protein
VAFPDQCHVDLETLDTRHTSKILSIGAVFNDEKFYVEIDQSHYVNTPFTESQSTVEWWAKRGGFQPSEVPKSPYEAITKFHIWLRNQTERLSDWEVWANSPTFDCEKLRFHMEHFSLRVPWKFYQERDVRTMHSLAQAMRLGVRKPENPHNALQDAANQRMYVESIYSALANHVQLSRETAYKGDNG